MGTKIILDLGKSEYLMWLFLKERDFNRPSMKEMVNHFDRNPRTIRRWLARLEDNGYI
ncbi:helix-turn-helix domain-containing protein [Ammoniphilus sp. YIM 78166]|uniref:helix-turn-helix domain-containing protein n=1 Tax=Ammoniphilus sp. YIM 78166 TaxID=1644106 RepID=UPI00143077FD|nr:helix-turn-helix domain-containing protein [Ammoniphilus sp. YIM 78166]